MKSRNYLLARSILFGAITKFVGAFMVFIGLPIISHKLNPSDYALFLRSMSAASFLTLFLNAPVSVSVRSLANAISSGQPDKLRDAEHVSMGLFIIAVSIGFFIDIAFIMAAMPVRFPVIIIAVTLSALGSLCLWGDSYRVALRNDHISSLWQIIGSITTLFFLIIFGSHGALAVVVIYFGGPFLAQLLNFIHLGLTRRFSFSPRFSLKDILDQIKQTVPVLIFSFSEYSKIYVSGLFFSMISSEDMYSRYTTIIILSSRLVNPISLISRPLMPAYIDAIRLHDKNWLGTARLIVFWVPFSGFFMAIISSLLLDPAYLRWIFPPSLGHLTQKEIVLSAIFIWGQICTGLLTPLYIAGHRSYSLAGINGFFVFAGTVFGGILSYYHQNDSMLVGISSFTALSAIVLLWVALVQLFSPRDLIVEDL